MDMRISVRGYIRLFKQKIDFLRFRRVIPRLACTRQSLGMAQRNLQPYYDLYVSTVSIRGMTISLELSAFLFLLCKAIRPTRILDIGSGFSSFVFRFYAKDKINKPVIWSVDDSVEWLENTFAFLVSHDLECDHLITWDSFVRQEPHDNFDLILHDLGDMEIRKRTFEKVLTLARAQGFIVLDDVHKEHYMSYVEHFLRSYALRYYSLKPLTKDDLGRFAGLVVKS